MGPPLNGLYDKQNKLGTDLKVRLVGCEDYALRHCEKGMGLELFFNSEPAIQKFVSEYTTVDRDSYLYAIIDGVEIIVDKDLSKRKKRKRGRR